MRSSLSISATVSNQIEMENEVLIPNEGSSSSQTEQESNSNQAKKLTIGTLGWWIGPLEEKRLGIIIDNNTLKLYEKSHYGYVPMVTHEKLEECDHLEPIENYEFVERRSGIFLHF